ncbi:hypothetical protein PF010_g584 [Phytophthora fragariae]|uniref:Uncharacterized protein n=1 Tax=Phytophthora fragariae TaxID=53985 RepID=A0A6G0PV21_9STRA|nr:hypothetical protein PF010_g584 [Phytophthora fragariae]KAE9255252.1 hypothetical protein PF004_g664 [Phytophthora fragariae]
MQSPERATDRIGGPYPEEILLEAYNLEWQAIELRHQRLQKTWQQYLLIEEMELEEHRYHRQLHRLKRQEKEKQERVRERQCQQAEAEAMRRQMEREEARKKEMKRVELEKEEARKKEKERVKLKKEEARKKEKVELEKEKNLKKKMKRMELEKQKKAKQVQENDTQTDEEEPEQTETIVKPMRVKAKSKAQKTNREPKQAKKSKPPLPKRITPTVLPPAQPEDDEVVSVSEENQAELDGYDSPPPELPDDGLLNMLDKSSDSDNEDEPSVASLILTATPSPSKAQPPPVKKKMMTPQKRFAKKKGGPPLDFNFSNAVAKRQAKAAEVAARAEEGESDEANMEPEPMPASLTPTPKKRLKRRKDALKGQNATGAGTSTVGKSLMTVMANTTVAVKPKKSGAADNAKPATTASNAARKNTQEEEHTTAPAPKKKAGGKAETMSIKQRLANAELLARMNKMQDISTPKVLGKKTKKTQSKQAPKRTDFRKVLRSDTADVDVPQGDQVIEERDLNISLNSSGLISDNDSPEYLRAPTRKRPRGAVDGDVTPTKKLQFLEITKRLAKSPMPRFLRTPTPLMSPVVASGLVKPRAASPAPRAASARSTAAKDYSARRMNSAPVRPKKATNANRFGIPAGGASTAASGGGFSMFDAFVNSGSSGAIPRLKTTARGDVSPSV